MRVVVFQRVRWHLPQTLVAHQPFPRHEGNVARSDFKSPEKTNNSQKTPAENQSFGEWLFSFFCCCCCSCVGDKFSRMLSVLFGLSFFAGCLGGQVDSPQDCSLPPLNGATCFSFFSQSFFSHLPFTELWNVSPVHLTEAMVELEEDFPSIAEPHRTALLFLYAKNVSKGTEDDDIRKRHFARLIDPASSSRTDYYTKARSRLDRLVLSGAGDTATNDPFHYTGDSLEVAFKKLPLAWSSPKTSFIFFRDTFPEDAGVLVQRYQRSGLCYMHAPAVVQHYAVCNTQGFPSLFLCIIFVI